MAASSVSRCRLFKAVSQLNGLVLGTSNRFYSIQPPEWLGGKDIFKRGTRFGFPEHSLSIEEKLKILENEKKLNGEKKHIGKNIGVKYQVKKTSVNLMKEAANKSINNKELEKAARQQTLTVPLDEVKDDWSAESSPQHIRLIADHYGIFRDLFGGDFFYPVTDLKVLYDCGEEHFLPACRGNIIAPSEASKAPEISFDSKPDELWTLLMVNPDENLTNQDEEYVHWLVANIPGGDISKGDVMVDYFQPIPVNGTGYHRNVFILFQQTEKMEYSEVEKIKGNVSLDKRHFKTQNFFKNNREQLTPKGLAFFQSQWDESVRHYLRNVLDMGEPSFEYDHPVPYHPPAKKYPHKEPFNMYFDRYRDRKDINEEVLRMKLRESSPFHPRTALLKYPLAHRPKFYKPMWLLRKEELMFRRVMQFKYLN